MNDSKIKQAIQKRLDDPNWESDITKRVIESQIANQSKTGGVFWKISAAILLVGLSWGVYNYSSHIGRGELENNLAGSGSTQWSEESDFLLDEPFFEEEFVLLGWYDY